MELYIHFGVQSFRYRFGNRISIFEKMMELYLQFGWGMMDHSRSLVSAWGDGTVILSPRDLGDSQLAKLAAEIAKLGGSVLLDPQFYLPYEEHDRLQQHDYWPNSYSSGAFWSGSALTQLLTKLRDLNDALASKAFVLPGLFAQEVNDDWVARQSAVIEESSRLNFEQDRLLATVALSADALKNDAQVQRVLEEIGKWDVAGIYLVCEHPNGDYLISDPSWLANVLDLVGGSRISGKKVIIGYCNQQMLIAASASANAIASGTWMNVRSFPPNKFRNSYDDEIKQRTTWYYCPSSLSEYKIAFLDIAQRQGVLDQMRGPAGVSSYADNLFSGPQPTTIPFPEQNAFRHYLECLRYQALNARRETFDATLEVHEQLLNDAENLLTRFHGVGIRGQMRDFMDIIDVNRAALAVLRTGIGPRLRRFWATL